MAAGILILAGLLAPEAPQRYDRELAETRVLEDATARSRARVEILYRAGDLPGALREALEGLAVAPADLALLRRALELESALRIPELARDHAAALERAVREASLDAEARRWWERECATLSASVRSLEEHESRVASATARARWIAILALGTLLAAAFALTRSRGPSP